MKTTEWNYSWGSWKAQISKHPRRNEYRWCVSDANGNDTYDFYNHLQVELLTPQEAEDDMFDSINDRIGHEPTRQIG
jgi:hypothetical protein